MNIPGLIEASAAEMGSADMFKNILLVRAVRQICGTNWKGHSRR